ncbi:hypothetical protein HW532_15615 [Kaustia mangrovi]|uniref:Uncharacterized protein n=1 Tax=Kaustia mangrovi TaxID=2593653 RepID=A0A7S8HCR0_9HYPH|nr:hypothetical protein [Kaustia mangrovi]QPC43992.1 hypothetical protein HW532_15615 [Kaustia mangrovi]
MIRNQNFRLLMALLVGAAVTGGIYYFLGDVLDAIGMPWWVYLIIWAGLSGTALQTLTRQAANETTIRRGE